MYALCLPLLRYFGAVYFTVNKWSLDFCLTTSRKCYAAHQQRPWRSHGSHGECGRCLFCWRLTVHRSSNSRKSGRCDDGDTRVRSYLLPGVLQNPDIRHRMSPESRHPTSRSDGLGYVICYRFGIIFDECVIGLQNTPIKTPSRLPYAEDMIP